MSDNVNHPKHYENGPFECIELSRLLSSDWGQVVQYCFRWQHKNGVEDLKKALWFINDALKHSVPPIAAWNSEDACDSKAQIPVSQILKLTDHKPLFGNKQPNRTGTHWIVFIKEDTE